MIARIEAINYRCLRNVSQDLGRFNVLVGPNGSGKSTFLDVVALLKDFIDGGLESAILLGSDPSSLTGRCRRVDELFFHGQGDRFELAIELEIPDRLRREGKNGGHERARYELSIGLVGESQELGVLAETFWLKPREPQRKVGQLTLFPTEPLARTTLLSAPGRTHRRPGYRKILNRTSPAGTFNFLAETTGFNMPFKSGPWGAGLAILPEDPDRFPVAMWAREMLRHGLQSIALNVSAMRRPCSPSLPTTFSPDGANLPRVVNELRTHHPDRFQEWVLHVREILTDVSSIDVVPRPEDKHLYIRIKHESGDPVPSWLLSDGTLRTLVLTLLPYLPLRENVYLIEEPENGVHPTAVETIHEALSSVYDNQVMLATHSPLMLGKTDVDHLLCFGRCQSGAAAIVTGGEHPQLRDWRGEVDLATLYAAGVLS